MSTSGDELDWDEGDDLAPGRTASPAPAAPSASQRTLPTPPTSDDDARSVISFDSEWDPPAPPCLCFEDAPSPSKKLRLSEEPEEGEVPQSRKEAQDARAAQLRLEEELRKKCYASRSEWQRNKGSSCPAASRSYSRPSRQNQQSASREMAPPLVPSASSRSRPSNHPDYRSKAGTSHHAATPPRDQRNRAGRPLRPDPRGRQAAPTRPSPPPRAPRPRPPRDRRASPAYPEERPAYPQLYATGAPEPVRSWEPGPKALQPQLYVSVPAQRYPTRDPGPVQPQAYGGPVRVPFKTEPIDEVPIKAFGPAHYDPPPTIERCSGAPPRYLPPHVGPAERARAPSPIMASAPRPQSYPLPAPAPAAKPEVGPMRYYRPPPPPPPAPPPMPPPQVIPTRSSTPNQHRPKQYEVPDAYRDPVTPDYRAMQHPRLGGHAIDHRRGEPADRIGGHTLGKRSERMLGNYYIGDRVDADDGQAQVQRPGRRGERSQGPRNTKPMPDRTRRRPPLRGETSLTPPPSPPTPSSSTASSSTASSCSTATAAARPANHVVLPDGRTAPMKRATYTRRPAPPPAPRSPSPSPAREVEHAADADADDEDGGRDARWNREDSEAPTDAGVW